MNGGGADPAMPAMPSMAAPPLPPKPKPSEPQARVLYDYDPAGQEGMVAVSAGQVRISFGGRLREDITVCVYVCNREGGFVTLTLSRTRNPY